MKRAQKITLASLGIILGIMSGVLTIVEKSINIVNSLKVEREASQPPENYKKDHSRQLAGVIEKDREIIKAEGVK